MSDYCNCEKHYCFACNKFFDDVLEICGSELTHYQCPICHTESRMIEAERMIDIIKSVWDEKQINSFLEGKVELEKI